MFVRRRRVFRVRRSHLLRFSRLLAFFLSSLAKSLLPQLPLTKKRVDFAVSEDPDLLVRQSTLHAVGVVPEIVLFVLISGLVYGIVVWVLDVWRLGAAREMCCLESLKVFLRRENVRGVEEKRGEW